MSTSDTKINMKSSGDSIQNYGHINLTIKSDGEREVRSKRKRKSRKRDPTQKDGHARSLATTREAVHQKSEPELCAANAQHQPVTTEHNRVSK